MKPIAVALENTFDKNNCVMLRIVGKIIVWLGKIAISKL